MLFEIFRANVASEAEQWDDFVDHLPADRRDIHFSSAYGRVQERLGARAVLACFTDDVTFVIQPFIIRPVPSGAYAFDLVSPYGYGGPVSNAPASMSMHLDAMMYFFSKLSRWCVQECIVSEFCRLHPMFAAYQFGLTFSLCDKIREEKSVVVLNLENLSTSTVSRRVRRALFKTQALTRAIELRTNTAEREWFSLMYLEAMMRKKAADRWRFPREYIDAHFDELKAKLFFVSDGVGKRMLMVIGSNGTAYAHLLASNGESAHSGLDERLYFDTGELLREQGFKLFHLGGGLTNDPSDSLLAFKRGFGGALFQTYTYRRIFDEERYAAMSKAKEGEEVSEHGRASKSEFFPAYRREFA